MYGINYVNENHCDKNEIDWNKYVVENEDDHQDEFDEDSFDLWVVIVDSLGASPHWRGRTGW